MIEKSKKIGTQAICDHYDQFVDGHSYLLRYTGFSTEYDHYVDTYDILSPKDGKIIKIIDFI